MHLTDTKHAHVMYFRVSATFGNNYAFVTVKFTAVTLKFQVAVSSACAATRNRRIPNE